MIDKIDIAQKAEMVEPLKDIVVQKNHFGIIVLKDALSTKHIGQPLPLGNLVLDAKWKLERRPITFMQAVECLRQGKVVSCETDGMLPVKYDSLENVIHIYEVVDGKWYLED
ncbi:hypothetical protein M5X00_25945 [Paenibacillus alvei]|uniref:hypothetical protein n=1 Tax=Paenibacillus alvei TaxID=44250 RepID=UPI00227E855F|nr:hypothetical protein [Paenibacillus alvei]MCY9757673.1 hypothetical protein [Paenibacillus alvei]